MAEKIREAITSGIGPRLSNHASTLKNSTVVHGLETVIP